MNDNTQTEALKGAEEKMEIEAMSVYRVLETVQDGRARRGIRYPVAFVLTLLL